MTACVPPSEPAEICPCFRGAVHTFARQESGLFAATAGERDPSGEFRLLFEAVSQLPEEHRKVVKALDGMIVKLQAKRMVGSLMSQREKL